MRAILPIAVLLALLTLGVGTALWLWGQNGAPAGPVARSAPEATAVHTAGPDVDVAAPEERTAAVAPEAAPATPTTDVDTDERPLGSAAVAGRLLVDGGPPGEVIALSLCVRDQGDRAGSWTHVVEVQSAPDGTFRFDGLADDWGGAILLPYHYRRVGVEDRGLEPRTVLARAGDLLRIDVERLPTLRGRLLGEIDHAPVVDAEVGVRAHWGHQLTMSGGRTDVAGRFQLPLREGTLRELSLNCEVEGGASLVRTWESADLPPANALGDIELGDLLLGSAQAAWLTVLDPDGAPIAGARAVERGSPARREFETDAQGRTELQLSSAPEGFEIQARGYSNLEIDTLAPDSELEVRLARANRLTIVVLDADGTPWPGCTLELSSTAAPFEGAREWIDEFLLGPGDRFVGGGRSRDRVFCEFAAGPDGRVELQGLNVGQALDLRALDALGNPGASASCTGLAAGEAREVRLVLGQTTQRLTGRCIDSDGQPVADARIELGVEQESVKLVTDSLGRFASSGLLVRELRLRASAPGFTDVVLDPLTLPAELELTLERGRTLLVELRDALGAAVDVGALEANCPGREGAWIPTRRGAAARRFQGVPNEPLELVHHWHGLRHTAQVDAFTESVTFELPALGTLMVRAPAFVGSNHESATLVLAALADERGVVDQQPLPSEGELEQTFITWPGRYRLRRVVRSWTEVGHGFREPAGQRELGEAVEVEVTAGETRHVVLEGAR